MNKYFTLIALVLTACFELPLQAARLMGISIIDESHLMVHLRDGEVRYRDDGTGRSAFLGHYFVPGDDTLLVFGERLRTLRAQEPRRWQITSPDDASYGRQRPKAVWRKSKPMNTNHDLQSELDHWLFLQLPRPMQQGHTYTVSLPRDIGVDQRSATVRFDAWNAVSEALHVNIIGYSPNETIHAADLYMWMGDGGGLNYRDWEGHTVWLYQPDTGQRQQVGKVTFWKHNSDASHEAGGKNLVGTDVWNIDFEASRPGRYRLVVEGIGCSMDFVVADSIYFQPYRYSVRGYYYMRIGEPADPAKVSPVPRQPRFIPGLDPKELVIYKTDLHPWHPDWKKLRGDVWDEPHSRLPQESAFWQHRLSGNPTNPDVRGGHSDAFDWDRHLAHISNIYDMLLPCILSGGKLDEDNLGIRESGNGLPDLIDEARNEVDFFLSIRDGEAYSQGVTNPSSNWRVMFQAGCTTIAAWANAANCAMLAEALRLQGNTALRRYYTDEAIRAFRFASRQSDQQLDIVQDMGTMGMRGRDLRQMAAAYLYNLTADRQWERIMAEESMIKSPTSPLFNHSWGQSTPRFSQGWATAAYLTCPHRHHYPTLYQNMLASVRWHAREHHLRHIDLRPSRRAANDSRWHTAENVQLLMLAHHIETDTTMRRQLEHALHTEAGWCMGRNPGNIVEMTGLGQRHITDAYTTGRNDGVPGVHPGQTPFNGTETWSKGNGGDAHLLLDQCYPSWDTGGWPRQESYFNQRYLWVNSEFTPRETMRGKMALLAYLHAIRKG